MGIRIDGGGVSESAADARYVNVTGNESVAGVKTFTDGVLIGAGTGTATGAPVTVLHTNVTSAGNIANVNEQTLWTYTLPANTLSADGKGLRITVAWTTAANANNKVQKVYFGATQIATRSTGDSAKHWHATFEVMRTGAATQRALGVMLMQTGLHGVPLTAPAEDTTAAIVIKFTGQSDISGAANDVVFQYAVIETIN